MPRSAVDQVTDKNGATRRVPPCTTDPSEAIDLSVAALADLIAYPCEIIAVHGGWAKLATDYCGQLAAYSDAIEQVTGNAVLESWLLMPVAGAAIQVRRVGG